MVPEAVFGEVLKHRPGTLDHRALPFRRLRSSAPEPPALEAQVLSLHTAEREALLVALEYRPGMRLTDNTAARLAAGNLGIVGTIGILVRAIRRRQRTKPEILAILRALPARSTLPLKRSLPDAVIHEVEIHA